MSIEKAKTVIEAVSRWNGPQKAPEGSRVLECREPRYMTLSGHCGDSQRLSSFLDQTIAYYSPRNMRPWATRRRRHAEKLSCFGDDRDYAKGVSLLGFSASRPCRY